MTRPPPTSTLFPYPTLFRSHLLLVLVVLVEELDLGDRLVRERVRHHEARMARGVAEVRDVELDHRSEEHTSELQSQFHLVCRLLLEKKNTIKKIVVPNLHSL